MAIERVESSSFPYLPIEIHIGEQILRMEALIDTGFDGDVAIPEQTVIDELPGAYRRWEFADGSVVEPPVYFGTVRVGGFDPAPADIAAIGEEAIVGRGIIERYRVILNHGERVTVER